MGVLLFVATVALIPGASTYEPRWGVLLAVAPLLLIGRSVPLPRWVGWGIAGVLAYAAGSMAWSPSPIDGAPVLIHLAIIALALCLGAAVDTLDGAFKGVCCGLAVNAAVAAGQHLGWNYFVSESTLPAGLMLNRNMLAELVAPALVWVVVSRHWRWVALPVPALLLAPDRAAVLALGLALIVWLSRYSRLALLALPVLAGAISAAVLVSPHDVWERLEIWQAAWSGLTIAGAGLNGFAELYPHWGYVHNDALQLAFDLGLGGLPIAALVIIALWGELNAERLVLLALVVESAVSFILYIPPTGFIAGLVVGRLVALRPMVSGERRGGEPALGRGLQRDDDRARVRRPARRDRPVVSVRSALPQRRR